jgi:hypothetical protein
MANRTFTQFRLALEKQPVDLFAQVAIGATGAPTLNVANSKGIASIARNSAGEYTITLQDAYVRLMMAQAVVLNATGISASPDLGLISADVVTAKTVVIQLSAAGTATDLASGDVLMLQLTLSNSTAP